MSHRAGPPAHPRDASSLSQDAALRVLDETVLKENARKRAGELFLGMRQRLGIAQAMLSGPSGLVLAEPTNNLDPPCVRRLRGYLRRHADEGRTVLLCGHALSAVEQPADHVLLHAVTSYLNSDTSP